jgi:hypothetical protein
VRSLTGATIAAFDAAHATVIAFARFDFSSGTTRYTTAGHDVEWGGVVWQGVGGLASIEEVRESDDLEAHGLKITLSGVPTSVVSLALTEPAQGRAATVWFGAINPDTRAIIADPAVEFVGLIDTLPFEDGAQTGSVIVNVESRLVAFGTPKIRRFTDADQQRRAPGDGFFRYAAALVEKELVWPSKDFGR